MVLNPNQSKFGFHIAQKALIKKNGKYLVLKRYDYPSEHYPITSKPGPYMGYWDFAGGKLEHNENPANSLKREVKEEINVNIQPIQPKFIFTEELNEKQVTFVVWETKYLGGKIKLTEHTAYKWAAKKEILKMKIEKFIREYFKQKKI